MLAKWLSTQPPELQRLRAYWSEWWDAHKHMTAAEIGKLIIERDLRLLEEQKRASGSALSGQHSSFARASLEWWTLGLPTPVSLDELRVWWEQHKSTYKGPQNPED